MVASDLSPGLGQGRLAAAAPPDQNPQGRWHGDPGSQAATPAPQLVVPAPSPQAIESPSAKLQASPPPRSAAAEEARILDQALTLLRRQHDATGALAALDGYLRRYPNGLLKHEARVARVDALLLLHRSDDALIALEDLPLDGKRRANELQVIRAELRARSSCVNAEADFTAALAHSRDGQLIERILYGRGACRAKLGDRNGAAQDLRQYLERFPVGPHAAWAKQWLARFDGSPKPGG
jgi:TolA-binding protein